MKTIDYCLTALRYTLVCGFLMSASTGLLSTRAAAQTIDESLTTAQGTYTLQFSINPAATASSPIADGTVTTFILGPNRHLCTTDLTLSGTSFTSSSGTTATWQDIASNVRFDLTIADAAAHDIAISFRNSTGSLYGTFIMSGFAAGTGTCGAVTTAPDAAALNAFFSSAETTFPALFPGGPFTFNQTAADGSTFRYYDSTDIFLTVKDGEVYARGGDYGDDQGQPGLSVGSFSALSAAGGMTAIRRPATIAEFFVGTYSAAMSDTQPFSPIPDGTELTYAIAQDGLLCLSDGTVLRNPLYLDNDTDRAVWLDDGNNRRFRVPVQGAGADEISDPAEARLQVIRSGGIYAAGSDAGGVYAGELQGERISLDTLCDTTVPNNPDFTKIEQLFDLYQQTYPDIYTNDASITTEQQDNYRFRYYPQTNQFIAVRNSLVYTGAGTTTFNGTLIGALDTVISQIEAISETPESFDPFANLTGTYEMTVSGAKPFTFLSEGMRIRVVVAQNGNLCVDNLTLTSPAASLANPTEISWAASPTGIGALLTIPQTATDPLTIDLNTERGENLGLLTGQRVNPDATCPGAVVSASVIASVDQLLQLLSQTKADLFPGDSVINSRVAGGAITHHFVDTDTTISVVDSEVFARGGDFGAADFFIGELFPLIQELNAEVDAQPPQPPPTSTTATLPGTYEMLVSNANPFAPFANGTNVRVVWATEYRLCISNTEFNFVINLSSPSLTWRNAGNGLSATLIDAEDAEQLALSLTTARNENVGILTGTRINDSTLCDLQGHSSAVLANAEQLFTLAEQVHDALFTATDATRTQFGGGSIYRFYPDTGITLSLVGSEVFARGGEFGTQDFFIDNLSNTLVYLQDSIDAQPTPPTPPSVTADLPGTYEMLVSNANPFAPFANNSRVRVVWVSDNLLCFDNIEMSLVPDQSPASLQMQWRESAGGLTASTDLSDPTELIFSLTTSRNEAVGTLQGEKISDSVLCNTAAPDSAALTQADAIFALAEQVYSELFPAGEPTTTQTAGGAIYRFYADTSMTVSIVGSDVFVRGGDFGAADFFVGSVSNVSAELAAAVAAQPTPPSVIADLPGTYEMLVSNANPFAPFANNSRVRVVWLADNSLCVDNLDMSLQSGQSTPAAMTWLNPSTGLMAALDLSDPTLPAFNLTTSRNEAVGTLQGARISDSTFCQTATPQADALAAADDLFALAEQSYADLFTVAANTATRSAAGAIYRHYTDSGITLSIIGDDVFVRGGEFGQQDYYVGQRDTLRDELRPPPPPVVSNNFSISVNGTASVSLTGLATQNRNINQSVNRTVQPDELLDENLEALAIQILSGEIQSPQVTTITVSERTADTLVFDAQLQRTTTVGSSTTVRLVTVLISLRRQ